MNILKPSHHRLYSTEIEKEREKESDSNVNKVVTLKKFKYFR